jgi:hypothetical protein
MRKKPMPPKPKEIELYPDAWERFERAMTVIGSAKPIHRTTKKPAKRPRPAKP